MSFDWKDTLAKVAPTIASAFGGPMAGVAVAMAAEGLGLSKGTTEADLGKIIAAGDPATLVKMREVETGFLLELERMGIAKEDIYAKDRASARELFKVNQTPQLVLSTIFVGGYFLVLFAIHGVLFGEQQINAEVMVLFGSLIGVFTRELGSILHFWFGSSIGSKEKTAHMSDTK